MAETDTCSAVAGLCFSHKVDIALIVTVLLFALGYVISSWLDAKKKKATRRQYLVALREEISLNIFLLDKSIRAFPAKEAISELLARAEGNRPLITFSYPSIVFRSRTEVLQDLPDTLIKNIVDFYGKLDQIAVDVGGISYPAFPTISLKGREEFIFDIHVQEQIALQQGRVILDAITLHIKDAFD
jgi:hypothetical protein